MFGITVRELVTVSPAAVAAAPLLPLLLLLLLLQINGKKLHPARGVFARFMTPLLLWWMLAFIIYGLSLNDLNKLQMPLTSLQVCVYVCPLDYSCVVCQHVWPRPPQPQQDADQPAAKRPKPYFANT
jgi:hypothetical protein